MVARFGEDGLIHLFVEHRLTRYSGCCQEIIIEPWPNFLSTRAQAPSPFSATAQRVFGIATEANGVAITEFGGIILCSQR